MKSKDRGALRRLAAEAILRNVKALAAQIPGVRARRGSEPVHDLRVASRRVRTALGLLDDDAPAKRYRRWNRELKRLASALSRARDTDVQAEFIREFLKAHRDPRLRPGIQRLLLRLRERREKQQVKIRKELDRFAARGTLREIRREFQPLKKHHRRAAPGHSALRTPHSALRTPIAPPILKRLDKLLAYEPFITQPKRLKELHRMRIAAKHFRYTLEAYAPAAAGRRLDPWIRTAKRLQTELGEIHDCDVWVHEALPKFLEDEREQTRFAEIKLGIAALRRDRRRKRNTVYRAFLRRWKKLRRQKMLDRRTLERMSEEP